MVSATSIVDRHSIFLLQFDYTSRRGSGCTDLKLTEVNFTLEVSTSVGLPPDLPKMYCEKKEMGE